MQGIWDVTLPIKGTSGVVWSITSLNDLNPTEVFADNANIDLELPNLLVTSTQNLRDENT